MRLSVEAIAQCQSHFDCLNECMGEVNLYARNMLQEPSESRTLRTETLRVLYNYQQDRGLGSYCLLVNGLIWDAEIVLRSVYEGFAKLLFVALAESDEADTLVAEFWNELGAIYDRKSAIKAGRAENFSKKFSSDSSPIFKLLQDERLFQTKPIGNKRSRKEIEARWSFAGIVEAIDSGAVGKFVGMGALLHQYGVASHLLHVSPKAFDLMEDRATREDDKILLEVGHACRVASDIVSLLSISAHLATRPDRGTRGFPPELKAPFEKMSAAIKADQKAFRASQDEFYRSWESA